MWLKFAASRLIGLAVDMFLLGAVYVTAVLLRFDLHTPRFGWRVMAYSFVTVAVVHVFTLLIAGCYRLSWRRTRLKDLPRYFIALFLACVVLTVLRVLLPVETYTHVRPPYTITLITFFLSFIVLTSWRIVWSWLFASRQRDDALIERSIRRIGRERAAEFFRGKVVMVTGAGGSIGGEIVRQLSVMGVKRLLMVERGENALYQIDRELREVDTRVPLMKDVNDIKAMREILERYRPEVILHAAAYKHVPMVEANPEEGWRNNTEATRSLANLAAEYGVRRFVLISTDKAVNPVSVMGKTKLAAENAIMEIAAGECSFCAVRFGNVLGSSGSVVPLFREQIAHGGPVTVTHPEMRRYFMTIAEAVSLVLQAATRSEKAIYTLDMGKPVNIVKLAEDMIRQAGYKPYIDIPIVFTGIRPGEKLFEELDVSEKNCYKTDMAKIYINIR